MGLRANFSMVDLGYALFTEELGIPIDYSDGCSIFADTFEKVAKSLVPVDTGTLQASITGFSSGEGCVCDASTEYAQYVEYGTYKMGAQPYFEPAISAALSEAIPAWENAVEMAQQQEEELLEEIEEAEEEAERGSRSRQRERTGPRGIGFSGGSILGLIIGAIIVGLFNVLMDILSGGRSSRGSSGMRRGMSFGGGGHLTGTENIEIEIY